MTQEQAKKYLSLIQAMAEGKIIQFRNITNDEWEDIDNPSFANPPERYRIKPESKYRSFKDAKECWKEMLKHQPFAWITNETEDLFFVVHVTEDGITLCNDIFQRYEDAFNIGQKFIDGVPFGIKKE